MGQLFFFFDHTRSFPSVDASGGVGFPYRHGGEGGDLGGDFVPEVFGDLLGGGVGQAWDFVEILMVEGVNDRLDDSLEVAIIHEPPRRGIDLAGGVDIDAVGVSMHSATAVARGDAGEAMGGGKRKCLDEFNFHGVFPYKQARLGVTRLGPRQAK